MFACKPFNRQGCKDPTLRWTGYDGLGARYFLATSLTPHSRGMSTSGLAGQMNERPTRPRLQWAFAGAAGGWCGQTPPRPDHRSETDANASGPQSWPSTKRRTRPGRSRRRLDRALAKRTLRPRDRPGDTGKLAHAAGAVGQRRQYLAPDDVVRPR